VLLFLYILASNDLSTIYLKFLKMDHEGQIRNKDFKLLRKLAGERIAEKYAGPDNYDFKSVGFAILKYPLINYAKRKPIISLIVALIVFITLIKLVWDYWVF
jgi:hypothetical protein